MLRQLQDVVAIATQRKDDVLALVDHGGRGSTSGATTCLRRPPWQGQFILPEDRAVRTSRGCLQILPNL